MNYNEFYVYVYLDPRKSGIFKFDNLEFINEPFYIGKGIGNRYLKHLQTISREKNQLKRNKINKIKTIGLSPIIIKYKNNISENEAYQLEGELIRKIGRIDIKTGPLTNLNDGGFGGKSNPSLETRFKYGTPNRGKTYEEIYGIEKSNELKLKRIESNKTRNIFKIIDRSKINSISIINLELTTKTKYNNIWVLTSPNNDIYITRNLQKTCSELKIHRGSISKLGKGIIKNYKNWESKFYENDMLSEIIKMFSQKNPSVYNEDIS